MARKTMSRQITKTTVKSAQMKMVDGMPEAVPYEDQVFIGNIDLEKAQRYMNNIQQGLTVVEVVPETKTYEMPVEVFMEHATIKEDQEETNE